MARTAAAAAVVAVAATASPTTPPVSLALFAPSLPLFRITHNQGGARPPFTSQRHAANHKKRGGAESRQRRTDENITTRLGGLFLPPRLLLSLRTRAPQPLPSQVKSETAQLGCLLISRARPAEKQGRASARDERGSPPPALSLRAAGRSRAREAHARADTDQREHTSRLQLCNLSRQQQLCPPRARGGGGEEEGGGRRRRRRRRRCCCSPLPPRCSSSPLRPRRAAAPPTLATHSRQA